MPKIVVELRLNTLLLQVKAVLRQLGSQLLVGWIVAVRSNIFGGIIARRSGVIPIEWRKVRACKPWSV